MRSLYFYFILFYSISGFGQSLTNPNISLNTLLTYTSSNKGNTNGAERSNGFALQEAELRFTSNIDSYFRADVILAVENEPPENPGDESEYVVEPEEVFIETISLPGVTIRLGKFYPFWGRSNQWHTHSLPFIDHFQTREAIFGHEGFNEVGASISYLLPFSWYSEINIQGFSAGNEHIFGSDGNDDIAGVFFLKNLWEINDRSTFEFNLGYGTGDDVTDEKNNIYNGAITYKNKFSDKRSLIFSSEYALAEKVYDEAQIEVGKTSALSSWLQFQMNKNWWVQARYELTSNMDDESVEDISKSSALIGYIPSEYSAIRLQYDYYDDPAVKDNEQVLTLQLNITMGSHPAHEY